MSESVVNNKLNRGGSRLLAFGNEFKRAAGMFTNPRVPLYLKLLLPVGAALYWFWPMDLLPGIPIDDVAVLLIALRLFLSLGERFLQGNSEAGAATEGDAPASGDTQVVDGTWQAVE